MTQMIELVDKNIKTITICYIFKKLKERLNMLSRDRRDIKKMQTEILGVKNILDCINTD